MVGEHCKARLYGMEKMWVAFVHMQRQAKRG